MVTTSIRVFRSFSYHTFRIIHIGCSLSIPALIWFHHPMEENFARLQSIVAFSVCLTTYVHRYLLLGYRNFSFSRSWTTAMLSSEDNILQIDIKVPRPWRVEPGQYVYLTVVRDGFRSLSNRHPFVISRSEVKSCNFTLRIEARSGLTRRLLSKSHPEMSALIEGPYGHGYNLRGFGTVMLLASDVGIVSCLSYLDKIIQDYRESRTMTRDLLLVWRVRDTNLVTLVREKMQEMLERDKDTHGSYNNDRAHEEKGDRLLGWQSTSDRPGLRPSPAGANVKVYCAFYTAYANQSQVLDIYIYVDKKIARFQNRELPQQRRGGRLATIHGRPNIKQIINDTMSSRSGRIAIYGKHKNISIEQVADSI